jgi:hypothetical protein
VLFSSPGEDVCVFQSLRRSTKHEVIFWRLCYYIMAWSFSKSMYVLTLAGVLFLKFSSLCVILVLFCTISDL